VEREPKKLIVKLMEAAVLFALSAFLIQLGVCYILQVWPILLILAIIVIASIIGLRIWKSKVKW